jgi:hypothetical protein
MNSVNPRSGCNALLDASILFSFDRSGYRRHARSFTPVEVDLAGRVCLVTGANSGTGCAPRLTKRMQVVLAELLAEELATSGVTVSAMHPGWADTPAVRSSLPRFWSLMRHRLRTPAEGADTVIWLAASPAARARSGLFWFDRQPRSTHLLPWTRESASDRAALRELCEQATGASRAAAPDDTAAVKPRRRATSRQ